MIFCRHEYKIPPGTKVVIDAGANIGTFSIYASTQNVQEIYFVTIEEFQASGADGLRTEYSATYL